MAFGALYIQQRLGVTDRETVELITESPYLQFFIGLQGFLYLKPFDASMMVHFRKRIDPELLFAERFRSPARKAVVAINGRTGGGSGATDCSTSTNRYSPSHIVSRNRL
jgi:hypothetical protein